MSKAYDRWCKRIKDTKTPWTAGEIRAFRKAIGSCGLKEVHLRQSLLAAFERMRPYYAITKEQSEKGRDYLLNKSLRRDGKQRKGNKLGTREIDILLDKRMIHYFVGVRPMGGNYVPIYRAVITGKDYRYFEYTGTSYNQLEVIQ